MNNHCVFVSLGMPVYNGIDYLRNALDSILDQSFKNFELIISDNASTDGTGELCREYAARDARVKYFANDINLGAAKNFNRVFELSSGKYFKWVAHDDICARDYLRKCVEALEQDSSAVLCQTRTKIIDDAGKLTDIYNNIRKTDSSNIGERFHDVLLKQTMCFEVFGLIRTKSLKMTPLIGNYSGSDRIVIGRLALMGKFIEIPDYLFFRRKHVKAMSSLKGNAAIENWFDPGKKIRVDLSTWKRLLENCKSMREVSLSLKQRCSCFISILKWVFTRRKALLYEIILAVKQLFVDSIIPTNVKKNIVAN